MMQFQLNGGEYGGEQVTVDNYQKDDVFTYSGSQYRVDFVAEEKDYAGIATFIGLLESEVKEEFKGVPIRERVELE